MYFALSIGLIFWILVSFFAFKKIFSDRKTSICKSLLRIKKQLPGSFLIFSILLFIISFFFCYKEVAAIKELHGVIGVRFLIAVIFGIIGSLSLSAHIFLKNDQE